MKKPLAPAELPALLELHRDRLPAILPRAMQPTVDGHYFHWHTLRRRRPRPDDLSASEWWTGIRLARAQQSRPLPLHDARGRPFTYLLPDRVQEALHLIDSRASGRLGAADAVTNPATRDRFIVNSLIQEAITSSQLEGASTTRAAAARMIRTHRRPRNRSERMILNNYRAMQAIRGMSERPLTCETVLELHRTVTEGTLDAPDASGRLQNPTDDRVEVRDGCTDRVLHHPPPAAQLPERLRALVRFANGDAGERASTEPFLHPVIRAIAVHFCLGYDHPFADGNGRTARALFYWALLRRGYRLFEFVSISPFLKAAPAQYARTFLETETDANDVTYFLVHQVDVIRRALEELDRYIARKVAQVQRVEEMLRYRTDLNHRQLALLAHAARHPGEEYTTRSHLTSHNVAYATARADLFRLAEIGLLDRRRRGRKLHVFLAPPDLDERIRSVTAAG